MEAQGKTVEIAGTEQTMALYKAKGCRCSLMGDRQDPVTLCARLFTLLRDMDERAEVILCEGVPPQGAGLAYMNRLLRAAGFQVEEV